MLGEDMSLVPMMKQELSQGPWCEGGGGGGGGAGGGTSGIPGHFLAFCFDKECVGGAVRKRG